MESLRFRITGVSPLIMHNDQGANPLADIAKQIKTYTRKRSKTDEDYAEIARLEWHAGLYVKNGRVVLPSECVEGMLVATGRKRRLGNSILAGVYCTDDAILEYDGPEDITELWGREDFRLIVGVNVQRQRVMRTRPIFREWAATIEVAFDPSVINADDLKELLVIGGQYVGLCDWRPKFGRFKAEVVE